MDISHDVPTHMLDNPDQYITKVGKFIRTHSLDEYDIIGLTRKGLENEVFARLVQ